MTIGPLHLMRPEWLWALLPAVLLVAGLVVSRRRAGSWSNVISPALLPHLTAGQAATGDRGRHNPVPWIITAWLLAVAALVGPSLEKIPQPVLQRADALVIVLDLSYSMKAEDLAPSRVDRARQKVLDLLAERREGQTGLVAFAGDAHVVAPLTDDNPTIANLLPALNPDMMPVPGSAPRQAVEQALELLHSGAAGQGRILLLTDGVSDSQAASIADRVRDAGVELIVMGVGTRTGAPLALPQGGFMRDDSGAIVIPTLDEGSLSSLATRSGGRYLPMQIDSSDLEALALGSTLPGRERLSSTEERADHWQDQGYLFIVLLLPLAVALFRRGAVVALLLPAFLAAPAQPVRADTWDDLWLTPDQQGQRALDSGDAARAGELFENPAWAGTAAYRGGEFEAAADRFARGDSADDWYNRGNALARAGDLEGAIAAYRESLSRQPDRSDASDNLELVEDLKQQREQQEQEGQQQQGQQQDPQQGDRGQQGQDNQQDQDTSQQNDASDSPGDSSAESDSTADEDQAQSPGQDDASTGNEQDGDSAGQPSPEQAPGQAPGENDPQERSTAAAQAAEDPEQAERDQAMELWLRRVPDDPSGLLREKFRYESRKRQQEGEKPEHDAYW